MKLMAADEEPFLADESVESLQQERGSRLPYWLIGVLTTTLVLNSLAIHKLLNSTQQLSLDSVCASHIEQYGSPILDDVIVAYNTVLFNGSFSKETIYRQRPSPEVDAAWDALGANMGGFIVPEDDGERFGLDPRMVKRKQSQGGGYVVLSEGFHHLHCLNLLRQTSHFNFPYYRRLGEGAFKNDDAVVKLHFGHCMDILRQQLMCTIDTGVFGQWWVKDIGPFVDFNTNHRCKNFHDIQHWAHEHVMLKDSGDLVERRKGDKMLSEIP